MCCQSFVFQNMNYPEHTEKGCNLVDCWIMCRLLLQFYENVSSTYSLTLTLPVLGIHIKKKCKQGTCRKRTWPGSFPACLWCPRPGWRHRWCSERGPGRLPSEMGGLGSWTPDNRETWRTGLICDVMTDDMEDLTFGITNHYFTCYFIRTIHF